MINHSIAHKKKNKEKQTWTADPTVIEEPLIREAIRLYNEENKILGQNNIPLSQLRHLSLSYKNIYRIQNLEGLDKLEKLQLDNNIIDEIRGISHLVNLKWLDLSFNLISKIEGLDKLVNLTDLSLYGNRIKVVEGLDNCTKLNVLSLGNNLLDNYESLSYLKRFRKLEVLNIIGNPFTKKDQDYKIYIMCHLVHLQYLDYSFIDEAMRSMAAQDDKMGKNDGLTLEQQLKRDEDEERQEKEKLEHRKELEDSKMHLLETFIDELKSEEDLKKIQLLKRVEDEVAVFMEKMREIVENLQKNVVNKTGGKLDLIKKFYEELELKEKENEIDSRKLVEKFENEKKHVFRDFDNEKCDENKMEELRNKLQDLQDVLMTTEMKYMELKEDGIDIFDYKLATMTKELIDHVNAGFNNINELIEESSKKIIDYAKKEKESYDKNPEVYEDNEDVASLLETPETLNMVTMQIKSNLDARSLNKLKDIETAIENDKKSIIQQIKDKQYERNRRNVHNIIKLIKSLDEDITKKLRRNDPNSEDSIRE